MDGYQQSSRYITGDDNGVVAIWRMVETDSGSLRLILMKSLSMTNIVANGNNPSIRSVCELDGKFLIATRGKEMHEVTESSFLVKKKVNDEVNSTTAAPTVVASRANVGHSSGEIWGLAKHPIQPVFITAGDDCTVRCWNLNSNEMISYIHVPEQARAVAVNPIGGLEVAIALNSGVIWIIPTDLFLNPEKKSGYIMDPSLTGKEIIFSPEDPAIQKKTIGSENIHTFQSKIKKTECKILANGPTKWIQTLQYSFDGSYLAAGSHDNCIYIFDCKKTYELRHKLSQHTGAVSHLDFGVMLKSPIVKYKNISVNKKMKTITRTKKIILEKYNDDNIEKRVIVTYEKTIKLEEEYEDMMVSIIPSPIADGVFSFQVGERVEVQKSDNSLKVGYISLDYGDKKTYDVEYESGEIETGVTIDKMHSIGGMLIGVGDPIKTIELESSDKFNEIRSIDLVENRICLASNSIDVGELFFWTLDGKFVKAISSMRDAWWASYTCPLGWSVQGIWAPTEDGTNIHAVARSHTWESVPVLAAVDNFGRVRLFNYPCVMPGASDKCYKGHASNVRNITFSSDDDYCITTGGTDGCIFVWATDIQDEIRERVACQLHSQVPGTDVYFEDVQKEPASVSMDEEEFSISKVILTGGDEFQAVKPWKGAIREPSHWKDSPEVGQLPQASLEMKFVYGYRGWDCRNNLFFTDSSYEVVYHIAGVGIVFDSQKNSQIHSVEHDNDIISIAVHPEGHTVATGEIGKDPKLVLWDSNTGVTIKVIEFHTRGISQLAFSGDGKKIVSIGMDDDRAIAVHVCETGALVGKGKAGRGINVYCMTVGGSSLITGGKRHVKFWELPRSGSAASELSSKSGIYNIKAVQSRIVLAAAYLGPDAVTGMSDGKILLWKDRTNTKFTDGHDGAVTAMCSINESGSGAIDAKESGPRVISGGKDGFVHIWDMQLKKIWSLNMNETTPLSSCPQIQAVATKENRLLIGTKASEIYEVNILSANEVYRLVQGHFHSKCEVWGLSAHPWMQRIVTCGDDMTVRVWDCKALQQLCISEIGMKARSVAYSKDGNQICVGIVDGKIVVLSSDLKTIIATVTVASSWIQVLQYSPDGSTLAVGSHDSIMYLLDTKSYSLRCKCKAHHSYITGIDFSSDSKVIQSVSGDYELLFWNKDGSRILSATDVRDVEWATTTCTLGWSVQGIWPLFSNGTDINAVDRSPDGQYLVSGDDFRRIKLFSYPSPKEKAKFKDYKGHAEHVTNVRFSADGKYVYSVGGLDKAVMQFEVKKEMSSIKKG